VFRQLSAHNFRGAICHLFLHEYERYELSDHERHQAVSRPPAEPAAAAAEPEPAAEPTAAAEPAEPANGNAFPPTKSAAAAAIAARLSATGAAFSAQPAGASAQPAVAAVPADPTAEASAGRCGRHGGLHPGKQRVPGGCFAQPAQPERDGPDDVPDPAGPIHALAERVLDAGDDWGYIFGVIHLSAAGAGQRFARFSVCLRKLWVYTDVLQRQRK